MENELIEAEPIRLLPAVTKHDGWQVAYMNETSWTFTRVCTREVLLENITRKLPNCFSVLLQNMQGAKKISVGDTVWALWPGSRRYYEATVLDVGKTTVQVDFKDGFTTEVALRQVYVRLIPELFVSCCPCRFSNYGELKQSIVDCLDRCPYLENEFAIW